MLQLAAHQEHRHSSWVSAWASEIRISMRSTYQLQYGDALAGIVAYRDDELAGMPLRDGRVRRLGRDALANTVSPTRRRLHG